MVVDEVVGAVGVFQRDVILHPRLAFGHATRLTVLFGGFEPLKRSLYGVGLCGEICVLIVISERGQERPDALLLDLSTRWGNHCGRRLWE